MTVAIPKSEVPGLGSPGVLLASAAANLLSMAMPLAIMQIYDRIIPNRAVETFAALMIGAGAAVLLEAALTRARDCALTWRAARFEHAASVGLARRLLKADPKALAGIAPGVHTERFSSVARIRDAESGRALIALADAPFVGLFLAMVYLIGGAVVLAPAAVVAIAIVGALMANLRLAARMDAADRLSQMQANFASETLGRFAAVKAQSLEAPMRRRYERLMRVRAALERAVDSTVNRSAAFSSALAPAAMVSVAAAGSVMVMDGRLTIGELAACMLLSNRALPPVQRIVAQWSALVRARVSREAVREGLSLPPAGLPRPIAPTAFQGGLLLQRVALENCNSPEPVLDGIDLRIEPGERIAIQGESGAGKTLLLQVMCGYLAPDRGRVLLDGRTDMRRVDEEWLRARIAYVPERAALFSGTLAQNLTMFDACAMPDETRAELWRRIEAVSAELGLLDLAGRLPNGFHTRLGPGSGHSLPQGFIQRIAIARAFLRQPRAILFDGANASLDAHGDVLVREALARFEGTLVIVSQRPSLVRICDRRFRLSKGKLIEEADCHELAR